MSVDYLSGSYEQVRETIANAERQEVDSKILNDYYNQFLSDYADDEKGHGKRIPYIGWYWRDVDFSSREQITIGDCGEFIGFMENNKWGYNERYLSENEFNNIINIIDKAISENRKGGQLSESSKKRDVELEKLWEYMQTLEIKSSDD